MKNNLLIIRQLDVKMKPLSGFQNPESGWINTIRKALNMSLYQLAKRLAITPQSLHKFELKEKEGGITLKSLNEIAEALEMNLVYGFVPKGESLEKVVEDRARMMAKQIVNRTSTSMKLEDQENSKDRLTQAIDELSYDLKTSLPRKLWD